MFKTIKVTSKGHGQKVDRAIALHIQDLSRRMIRRALDTGSVYINKKRERFASTLVYTGDVIEIKEAPQEKSIQEKIEILEPFIVYEDKFIIAINKPPFLLSQKTVNKNLPDAKAVLQKYLKETKKRNEVEPLILCHRLDKETSGVLVFAKSKESCDWVMSQFKERQCKKTYEALCFGLPKEMNWEQKDFLGTLKNKEQKVKPTRSGGKTAITAFTCLKKSPSKKISLISCAPLTGRTHQIRVQLSLSRLPILGDKKYGISEKLDSSRSFSHIKHHLLHAKSLKLKPSKDSPIVTIRADHHPLFEKQKKQLG